MSQPRNTALRAYAVVNNPYFVWKVVNPCHFVLKNLSLTQSIFARSSKLRMYGAEGMNAIGTELLDQFGRVQTPNRKGIVGKN